MVTAAVLAILFGYKLLGVWQVLSIVVIAAVLAILFSCTLLGVWQVLSNVIAAIMAMLFSYKPLSVWWECGGIDCQPHLTESPCTAVADSTSATIVAVLLHELLLSLDQHGCAVLHDVLFYMMCCFAA